ncbi:MAG: cyclic nucleotide-binding domain-containing protein [Candidatus Hydrogenedentota bacterium]
MQPDDPRLKMFVENVEIFNGLETGDVYKIFAHGMTQRVQKGETIFHKGTTGNIMYVVLGGKVGVFDGPKCVAEMGVGNMFGELSLLNGQKRSATVIALEDSNLFSLSEEVFNKLLTKRVAVQMLLNVAKSLGRRLIDSNRAIREIEGR